MLSHRTFGVEIECGHDTLSVQDVKDRMERDGFPVYKTNSTWTMAECRLRRRQSYGGNRDGSGIEIKTPVLKGEKGYRELTRIMDYLTELGCWVTTRDGMHVHIGAAGFENDPKACATLARSFYNNQTLIEAMVSRHRAGLGATSKMQPSEIPHLGQRITSRTPREYRYPRTGKYWGYRRALNLAAVAEHGTVEFRLHEGCLDPVKALAWIKFCQKFVDHAAQERKPLTCASNKTALLTTLGVPQDAIAHLSKKQKTTLPALRYVR